MKHLANKLDARRFVWVLLLKMHDKPKSPVLEGCIRGTDDDRVPESVSLGYRNTFDVEAYQVITLSATGEAETPAGGSVCIRYDKN